MEIIAVFTHREVAGLETISLGKEVKAMVGATKEMLKPLRTLDKGQVAAVNLLILERDALMGALLAPGNIDF